MGEYFAEAGVRGETPITVWRVAVGRSGAVAAEGASQVPAAPSTAT